MLKLINFFKIKQKKSGFYANDLFVDEIKTPIYDGVSWLWTCSFSGFTLRFEYNEYNYTINEFGTFTVLYKETVVYQDIPNLSLNGVPLLVYLKKYFESLIAHVQKIDSNHLDIILPLLKTKVFTHTRTLELQCLLQYPTGFFYKVLFSLTVDADYNAVLRSHSGWTDFKIVSYDNKIFSYLYNEEHNYSNTTLINRLRLITQEIYYLLYDTGYTLHQYRTTNTDIFYDTYSQSVLLYTVIDCRPSYFPSETKPEFFNNISIHLFWQVNENEQSTELTIFIYNKNVLIEEYRHSMEKIFTKNTIDIQYYLSFFNDTLEKLVLSYFPSRKLLQLLEIDPNDNFNGRLTEDQYYLFKMIHI